MLVNCAAACKYVLQSPISYRTFYTDQPDSPHSGANVRLRGSPDFTLNLIILSHIFFSLGKKKVVLKNTAKAN